MANTFKFGNKQWYGKKGSVLAYNDENNNFKPLPFDFTRSSSATRVNKDGLIEVVGSDEPRVDYLNNADGHLLLEPSRTNLSIYSDDFSQSEWVGINTTTELASVNSPDGTQNAYKLIDDSTNGLHTRYDLITGLSTTGSYSISCFVKQGTLRYVGLQSFASVSQGSIAFFDLQEGNLVYEFAEGSGYSISNSKIENIGNGWYRISATMITPTTGHYIGLALSNSQWSSGTAYDNYYSGSGEYIYCYGFQYESGSYATSYIPTSGSSVTRAADNCSQTPASGVIGQTEGTLFIDFVYGGTSNTVSDNFNLTLGTWASNIMTIGQYRDALYARIYESSTLYFNQDFGNMTIGQRYKCAVGYAANNVSFYVNGSLVATDTTVNIPTVSNIILNRSSFENAKKINQVILHDTRLSNAELATLTSI